VSRERAIVNGDQVERGKPKQRKARDLADRIIGDYRDSGRLLARSMVQLAEFIDGEMGADLARADGSIVGVDYTPGYFARALGCDKSTVSRMADRGRLIRDLPPAAAATVRGMTERASRPLLTVDLDAVPVALDRARELAAEREGRRVASLKDWTRNDDISERPDPPITERNTRQAVGELLPMGNNGTAVARSRPRSPKPETADRQAFADAVFSLIAMADQVKAPADIVAALGRLPALLAEWTDRTSTG